MLKKKTSGNLIVRWLGRLSLVGGLAVSAWLLTVNPKNARSAAEPASRTVSFDSVRSNAPIANATRPIQTIRIGDRVLAHNPAINESERASLSTPDWSQCVHLSLRMPLAKPGANDGDTQVLEIEILRPESWMREHLGLVVHDELFAEDEGGSSDSFTPISRLSDSLLDIAVNSPCYDASDSELIGVTIEIDLPEMGAQGTAVINDIAPCPGIPDGDGHVVTATFSHPPTSKVLDVFFEGETESIGVTDNHLFWSVDRQDFLPIGAMKIGEKIRTYAGQGKRIESVLPRPGPETVYNLEVYGEHVYFVGQQGLLAHNSYLTRAIKNQDAKRSDGLIGHINPRNNKLEFLPRSQLHGDHILPKQRINNMIARHESRIGRKLSRAELRQVNSIMNGPQNLRPMIGRFNSSKQDFLAATWRRVNSDLSNRVSRNYLRSLARAQLSVHREIRALLGTMGG